ncbi:Phosphate regulon transcriptional regulatory protein PhoB [Ensifer adhaerens]|uniref:winged helix-turn-helix transcriptional regulator n=1 Tax=Ensifer adhaerens TaxID=106592 RepID=UPI0015683890|nr:response regulator transcription factor [Ensifer adhaerens]NRP21819.1 Phosphate regulon transcriptional regulatory protein PhoB [Ensifer adhaerens]
MTVAECTFKRLIVISSCDAEFCLSHQHILAAAGHDTELSTRIEDIMTIASQRSVGGVLLDARTVATAKLCEELKGSDETRDAKVIGLLSTRAAAEYPAFLKAGIDVAFVRPVEPARYLRAFRRLLGLPSGTDQTSVQTGVEGLTIDRERHQVSFEGCPFHIGLIEFRILLNLACEPGKVLSRKQLIASAWPSGIFVDARTVNVHIARLRRSLLTMTGVDPIRTVRGVGYAIAVEDQQGDGAFARPQLGKRGEH